MHVASADVTGQSDEMARELGISWAEFAAEQLAAMAGSSISTMRMVPSSAGRSHGGTRLLDGGDLGWVWRVFGGRFFATAAPLPPVGELFQH